MKSTFLLICILIATLSLKSADADDKNKIDVTVLYESLCPDSQNFIQNQLYKNYDALKEMINLNLVPFGKSKSHDRNGKIYFTCQHGRDECDGNRYQSCVLNLLPDQDSKVDYVSCAMKFYYDLDYCAEKIAKVDMEQVQACRQGLMGTQLQLDAERRTTHVISQSRFVPTIVYNNQYDQVKNWKSMSDFKKTVEEIVGKK